ncbi:sensor histidine kinase [Erythrobacter sp. 3-20A1M]|uniref:sensor histidine kinase n=1 Tax=Erythrobacter sp. 3-20A1M TaxID=2653850 RepID=UPI001BFC80A3|nr:HAMP domain-containing sensor histidine kinase [Erythrobacter sp. 3-20A1M]QWC58085.1 sensor histidine kinase [Erythrobacter sp. 3-20A1M]
MTGPPSFVAAAAVTDGDDRLVCAEEPLASLQRRCGGELPGAIALPELREAIAKAREMKLRSARHIRIFDGEEEIVAWVEIGPRDDDEPGCAVTVSSWQKRGEDIRDAGASSNRRDLVDEALAEFRARLDSEQKILWVQTDAPDLSPVVERMREGPGRVWTDFVELPGSPQVQPLHWRLLDRTTARIEDSPRSWTVRLLPLGAPIAGSDGFELLLVADRAWVERQERRMDRRSIDERAIARDLAPVLRQPISRIIANAETIRSRLAGPLRDEYADYATDIAAAGQHLLSLVDDLADLEVVESADFETAPDRIELSDVVRRAAGILGARAQERAIFLRVPPAEKSQYAVGEFRRVLQVLLNVVGNAIKYSPEGATVDIGLGAKGDTAYVAVRDSGPGLDADQQARVFRKFERLGRSGDGGSGLGLYISRKLAQAMGGTLQVASEPGKGAIFTLTLTAAPPE